MDPRVKIWTVQRESFPSPPPPPHGRSIIFGRARNIYKAGKTAKQCASDMQQEKTNNSSSSEDLELGTATFRVVEDLQSVGVNVSEIKKLQEAGTFEKYENTMTYTCCYIFY